MARIRLFAIDMSRVLHDVHLDGRPESCLQVLLESPVRWLPAAQAVADSRYRARVRFHDGVGVRKEVALTVRKPTRQGNRLVIPVIWRATGPKGLFPVFEGEFRLRPLRPSVCRLSLSCTYEPPLGDFGRRLDEAGLRRMAEATVRDITCAVATRVVELASSQRDGRPLVEGRTALAPSVRHGGAHPGRLGDGLRARDQACPIALRCPDVT